MYKSILTLFLFCLLPTISLFSQGKVTLTFNSEANTSISLQKTDNHLIPNYQEVPLYQQDKTDQNTYLAQIERADYYRLNIGDKTFGLHLQPGNKYNLEIIKNKLVVESEDKLNQLLALQRESYLSVINQHRGLLGKTKKGFEEALQELAIEIQRKADEYQLIDYGHRTILFSQMYMRTRELTNAEAFQNFLKVEVYPIMDFKNKEFIENTEIMLSSKANYFNIRESQVSPRLNPTLSIIDEAKYFDNKLFEQFSLLQYLNMCVYGPFYFEPDMPLIDSTLSVIIKQPLAPIISVMANSLRDKINTLQKGKPVEDFSLDFYKQDKSQLSAFNGKVIVLDFWFSGCKPCLEAIPEIKELIAKHEKDLVFISVDPVDTEERFLKMVQKKDMNWAHILTTEDDPISEYFNVGGYPTYIVIDREGNFYGDYTSESFMEAVKELLP